MIFSGRRGHPQLPGGLAVTKSLEPLAELPADARHALSDKGGRVLPGRGQVWSQHFFLLFSLDRNCVPGVPWFVLAYDRPGKTSLSFYHCGRDSESEVDRGHHNSKPSV